MRNEKFEKIIESLEQLTLPLVMRGNWWHDYYLIDRQGELLVAHLVSRAGYETLPIEEFLNFIEDRGAFRLLLGLL